MPKKIIWLLVSCIMVLSLAIASCGQTTTSISQTTPAEQPAQTAPATEKPQQAPETTAVEKPQYGGTIFLAEIRDFTNWANGLEFC